MTFDPTRGVMRALRDHSPKGVCMMNSLKKAALLLLATSALAACGSGDAEYSYDSASLFPEDYQAQYTALTGFDCTKSPTHGGDYVRIYASSDALPIYDGMEVADGAVLVKPQYSDASCEELSAITSMKRDSTTPSEWVWQRVGADGSVESSGQVENCVSCHTATCGGNQCAER